MKTLTKTFAMTCSLLVLGAAGCGNGTTDELVADERGKATPAVEEAEPG
jgi:hypothetical protein